MENNYYCLVAGLPDISVDDTKLKVSLIEMKEELQQVLSADDLKLINLFLLKFDNQNLLNLLLENELDFNELGNFSKEDLEGLVKQIKKEGIASESIFPIYIQEFIGLFFEESSSKTEHDLTTKLISAYYCYVQASTNAFVSSFFEFEQNLWNVITAINCRKFEMPAEKEIIGKNEISMLLKKSSAKDFGLTNEFHLIEKLLQISEETNLLKREKLVDNIRWELLDEDTFFNYFTVEKVFAYMVKLEILERWTSLNEEQGLEEFNKIIKTLESSYEVPAEF